MLIVATSDGTGGGGRGIAWGRDMGKDRAADLGGWGEGAIRWVPVVCIVQGTVPVVCIVQGPIMPAKAALAQ